VCDLASDPTPPSVSPAVARALRHVHDHPGSAIGVDALAAVAGMSRAHFVRTFAAEVGQAPSRYVLAARLERARQLLAATDDTIAAIGRSCGFADASYFAKAFRRACATTPASYRRSVREGVNVRRG
jgi:AraC family transcriptional regulator